MVYNSRLIEVDCIVCVCVCVALVIGYSKVVIIWTWDLFQRAHLTIYSIYVHVCGCVPGFFFFSLFFFFLRAPPYAYMYVNLQA